jgi:hypothetical protein
MLRPLVRSLVSAMVATCFALGAISWGRPMECVGHATTPGQHDGSQDRSRHHGQAPASQVCAVHLCCAHVAPGARTSLAPERLGEIPAAAGSVAATATPATRSAHTLPFANAPPFLS